MPLWLKCKERKVLPKLRTTHITRARQKVLIKTQIIVANIHGVLVFKQGSASTLQTLSQFILITLLRIANDCPHFRDKETEEQKKLRNLPKFTQIVWIESEQIL
jgi:hypothetical protein